MYSKIQEMKSRGFSIRQVTRIIRVSRNTIRKYWEMPPEEYARTYTAVHKRSSLDAYEPIVLKWLESYPCMTAAQVRDWLEEKFKLDASERTVRRFVADMREKYGISKETEPKREYEAVEELPKGHQLQLDFGEKNVKDAYSGRYIKLYFAVFTLSYSREMWGIFQKHPFTSTDLVNSLYGCFEYFGGMPNQLVYDQDSIIVVSENGGDIIHTHAFTAFLAESKLDIRACRKSDPETKGLIEASVKFVKGNFMENRLYMSLDVWNCSFEDWLIRVGKRNHGTTKRKPVEMFADEQKYLLPLYGRSPITIEEEMERNVRTDNTVWYLSNRYSVPYGTYKNEKKVFLEVEDKTLKILSLIGDEIAVHDICTEKGRLIKLDIHRRNKGEKTKNLKDNAVALLGDEFREYIEILCERKPRYVKEQLDIIIKACEGYGRENILTAMHYCADLELYSANDLREAAMMLSAGNIHHIHVASSRLPVEDERYHISVQKRPLSIYSEVALGSVVAQ